MCLFVINTVTVFYVIQKNPNILALYSIMAISLPDL